MKRYLLIMAVITGTILAICGCAQSPTEPEDKYQVTLYPNGASAVGQVTEKMTKIPDKSQLFNDCGYNLNNWNTKADGSGDKYKAKDTVPEKLTLYAQWDWKSYVLGDTGPAGGIILIVTLDTIATSQGWKYLEVAQNDQSSAASWGDFGTTVVTGSGAAGSEIGDGGQNTNDIVTHMNNLGITNTAAQICAEYSTTNNGITFRDWFLPSEGELYIIYSEGLLAATYWSSTQMSENKARAIDGGGAYLQPPKDTNQNVRAARTF